MKKVLFAFLLFVLGFALVACGEEPVKTPTKPEPTKTETVVPTETKEPKVIDFNELEITLKVGDTKTLDIKEEVGFAVSNKTAIDLDKASKTITAKAAGESVITVYLVEDTSVSIEIKVTVTEPTKVPTVPETPIVTPEPTEVLPESIEIVMSNKFTNIEGIGQNLFEVLNPYISKISVTYLNKVLKIRLQKEDNWVKDLGIIIECVSVLYKQHKKKGKEHENWSKSG